MSIRNPLRAFARRKARAKRKGTPFAETDPTKTKSKRARKARAKRETRTALRALAEVVGR